MTNDLKFQTEHAKKLAELFRDYIKLGLFSFKELSDLFHLLCQNANYMGIYRELVYKEIRDFG